MSTNEKLSAMAIIFERAEGLVSECRREEFTSFAEVDAHIRKQAQTAPATGGYDKCDFTVIFQGGEEYSGRFDMQRDHVSGGRFLQNQISRAFNYYASGKCPNWILEHNPGLKEKAVKALETWDLS